ncbi:MAG: 4-hydroxy-tetrahydrodipicolinate reductase [Chlamydiae bacterium]|nr:4-hydroxy-tetrahydrodipicolinate reductase [Chlamydiota bacterium]
MDQKIKFVMNGASGRMGRQIILNSLEDPTFQLVGALEREGSSLLGEDVGTVLGRGPLGVKFLSDGEEILKNAQVVIDFSSPEATLQLLKIVEKKKIPLVVGTTGFKTEEEKKIHDFSKKFACVKAPNMSVGVNLLFKLVEEAAPLLKDYDIEIIEAHHRLKKDAPSGTAKGILKVLAEALGRDLDGDVVSGRSGMVGERKKNEIGVFAVRAGDIVGDHTILFAGSGERLELIHRAHSREPFAKGALRAAQFVVKAKAGLYDMQDVLGLR